MGPLKTGKPFLTRSTLSTLKTINTILAIILMFLDPKRLGQNVDGGTTWYPKKQNKNATSYLKSSARYDYSVINLSLKLANLEYWSTLNRCTLHIYLALSPPCFSPSRSCFLKYSIYGHPWQATGDCRVREWWRVVFSSKLCYKMFKDTQEIWTIRCINKRVPRDFFRRGTQIPKLLPTLLYIKKPVVAISTKNDQVSTKQKAGLLLTLQRILGSYDHENECHMLKKRPTSH